MSPLPPERRSASSAAASSAACWRWPPPGSATAPSSSSRRPIARRRRSPTGRSSPPMTTRPRSPNWRASAPSSPTSSRTCRSPPPSALAGKVPVYPPPRALEVAQDRLTEKRFLNEHRHIHSRYSTLWTMTPIWRRRWRRFGGSGVLKTRRLGYDGKGQRVFRNWQPAALPAPVRRWAACR